MALVTVQRSPSPSGSPESDTLESTDGKEELKSPGRQRRPKSALKRLRKLFHTVRFISKLKPCFSESYFAVKGAALILPQSDCEGIYSKRITKDRSSGNIRSHLQSMFYLLRPADTIKVAVKLESIVPTRNRYLAVVSCSGRQDTEESVILGIDCTEKASIELVLPVWANTAVRLDGEGGFSITSTSRPYLFKPVSVQAMWSALQNLNKAIKVASDNTYIPRGLTHTWVGFYESKINTEDFASLSEWHIMEDTISMVESFSASNRDEDAVKKKITTELKNIMMCVDLEDVTVKFLHEKVEESMQISLKEYKSYIDQEMLVILGQMDAASKIEDFLYLGSEWNASNLEELKANGVGYILNISREIDNFFPGYIKYMNIREWDVLETDLMKYWNNTYEFIQKARKRGSKVLVHCRMGISRSASTVMAFLMKECKLTAKEAFDYVKKKRSCVHPNDSFWKQLETYEGILKAKRQFELQHLTCGRQQGFFKSKSEPNFDAHAQQKNTDGASRSYDAFLGTDLYIPESPEDWLNVADSVLMKTLGKSEDCAYEQDFELSSRESTEESVQDIPSPKPEEVSEADSEVLEFSRQISGILVTADTDENRQDVGKDKGLAMQEVSGSKIKPDSSWIREAKEEEDDDFAEIQNIVDMTQIKDIEGDQDVISCDDDNEDKVSGIWMTTKSHSMSPTSGESVISEESKGSTNVEIPFLTEDTVVIPNIETGIKQHYAKENIPWHPGTVKKQKYDLEERLKSGQSSQKSDDDDDDDDDDDEDEGSEVMIYIEGVPWNPKLDPVQNESASTPMMDNNKPLQIEGFHPELNLPLKPCLSCSDVDEMEGSRLSSSVYEREEIMLEPGTVMKARQEIENRNRTIDDWAVCPLQRSASLRVKRVTPKSRDRKSERRRTCTPVLSPRSASTPDLTLVKPKSSSLERMEPFLLDNTTLPSVFNSSDVEVELLDDSDQPIDIENMAVYKFGDEEVSLQKGIVKRQKMDIEQKSKESSPVVPSEHVDQANIHSDVGENELSDKKKLPDEETLNQSPPFQSHLHDSIQTPSLSHRHMPEATHAIDVKPSTDSDSLTPHLMSEKKSAAGIKQSICSTDTDNDNLSQTPVKCCASKEKIKPMSESGRFDRATLELIRDIGSALLNSPTKPDKEEDEDSQEKCGLVKYFVRNIEEENKSLRKRSKKEIIIVDKDPHPKKTENKSKKSASVGSEKMSLIQCAFNEQIFKKQDSEPYSSPKKHAENVNMFVSASSSAVHNSEHAVQTKTGEINEDHEGHGVDAIVGDECHGEHPVKCLVGKFEHTDKNDNGSASVDSTTKQTSTPLSPYRDIIVESKDEKSDEAELRAKLEWQTGAAKGTSFRREGSSSVGHTERRYLNRPKSAEHSHRAIPSCNFGNVSGRNVLQKHSNITESSQDDEASFFTWEGKKVRKLTGKTHPLTKLENQGYWTQRKNPFYNTM